MSKGVKLVYRKITGSCQYTVKTGEMCPLDKKKISSPFPSMSNPSLRSIRTWKSATKNSVQPKEPPGCPEFTLCTCLNMSLRTCIIKSLRYEISGIVLKFSVSKVTYSSGGTKTKIGQLLTISGF